MQDSTKRRVFLITLAIASGSIFCVCISCWALAATFDDSRQKLAAVVNSFMCLSFPFLALFAYKKPTRFLYGMAMGYGLYLCFAFLEVGALYIEEDFSAAKAVTAFSFISFLPVGMIVFFQVLWRKLLMNESVSESTSDSSSKDSYNPDPYTQSLPGSYGAATTGVPPYI